jgi:hypothetical protein
MNYTHTYTHDRNGLAQFSDSLRSAVHLCHPAVDILELLDAPPVVVRQILELTNRRFHPARKTQTAAQRHTVNRRTV